MPIVAPFHILAPDAKAINRRIRPCSSRQKLYILTPKNQQSTYQLAPYGVSNGVKILIKPKSHRLIVKRKPYLLKQILQSNCTVLVCQRKIPTLLQKTRNILSATAKNKKTFLANLM
jgi:hypothetical protein